MDPERCIKSYYIKIELKMGSWVLVLTLEGREVVGCWLDTARSAQEWVTIPRSICSYLGPLAKGCHDKLCSSSGSQRLCKWRSFVLAAAWTLSTLVETLVLVFRPSW